MTFWTGVFWLCLAGLVYVYAGYPLWAWLLGRALDRGLETRAGGAVRPRVTVLIAAFNEDRDMITAQHRNILLDPSAPMLPLAMDSALIQFRRMLDEALDAESR